MISIEYYWSKVALGIVTQMLVGFMLGIPVNILVGLAGAVMGVAGGVWFTRVTD